MIERVVSHRARCCEGEREGEREGQEGRKVSPWVSVEIERTGPERAQLARLADVVSYNSLKLLIASSFFTNM